MIYYLPIIMLSFYLLIELIYDLFIISIDDEDEEQNLKKKASSKRKLKKNPYVESVRSRRQKKI